MGIVVPTLECLMKSLRRPTESYLFRQAYEQWLDIYRHSLWRHGLATCLYKM